MYILHVHYKFSDYECYRFTSLDSLNKFLASHLFEPDLERAHIIYDTTHD